MEKVTVKGKDYQIHPWKYLAFLRFVELREEADKSWAGAQPRKMTAKEMQYLLSNRLKLTDNQVEDLELDEANELVSKIADSDKDEGKKNQ